MLALAVLGGCAPAATGTLGPRYFKHNESGYELIYAGDGPAGALGPGWTLDNFQRAPARGGATAFFPREGEAYSFDRHYDFDGDGVTDYSMRRAIYDLLFTQDGGAGRIWMRSIALAPSLEGKPLDALARRYVSKVERVGLPFANFGEGQPAGVAQRAFPARVISDGAACEVANVPAFRLDFELEGLAEGPRRVTVVLMRPGYAHQLALNGVAHRQEVILQAVHTDAPEAFASTEPTFEMLLDHLSLARGQAKNTCVPGAAEAAP